DYFRKVSGVMDLTHDFSVAILDHLQVSLDQRLSDGKRSMLVLVVALALVLLVLVWLYLGFYVSTRRTISDLSQVMRQVAAGDMTGRVVVTSRGELGQLATELKTSGPRTQALPRPVRRTPGQVSDQPGPGEEIATRPTPAVEARPTQREQAATAMSETAAASQEVARSAALAANNAEQVDSETLTG